MSKYKGLIERWLTRTFSIFLLSYVEVNNVIKASRADAASDSEQRRYQRHIREITSRDIMDIVICRFNLRN